MVSIVDSLNNATTSVFDLAGRNTGRIDAKGHIKTMQYDAVGQLTTASYFDGTQLLFSYDKVGNQLTMNDSGGVTSYAYTARYQIASITLPSGNVMTATYDAVKNRTKLTDPDAGAYSYAYDALNRVASMVVPAGHVYTGQYDAAGRNTTIQVGLGSTRQFGYDPVGRTTSVIELGAALAPIATLVDSYDGIGRKTTSNRDNTVTSYVYDNADRLTGQQLSGAYATFNYDAVGNVSVKWHQGTSPITMNYNAADQIVTSIQGTAVTTYTYDSLGNMTAENNVGSMTGYAYDPENRLTVLTHPDGTFSTYSYAGDGLRRNRQEPGGVVTLTIWDGQDYLQERS